MDLKSVLLPSHSIELSIHTLDDERKPTLLRLKSVIETGLDNHYFKIATPMLHGRNYTIQRDETIGITFNVGEGNAKTAYEIKCKVVERSRTDDLHTITLKVLSEPEKVQRRDAFRVNIMNTYAITYKGRPLEIVSKDISATGMRALATNTFGINDTFTIEFNANQQDFDPFEDDEDTYQSKIFKINCKVIDCMPQTEIRRYMLRLQFLDLTKKESQLLIQYLYAKQSEIIATDSSLSQKRQQMEHLFELGDNDVLDESDPLVKRYEIIGLINLFVIFIGIVAYLFAKPDPLYVLDHWYKVNRPKYWHAGYFTLSTLMTALSTGFVIYGLFLNRDRLGISTDKINRSLLIGAGLAFVMIIVLLVAFITQDIYNVTI